MKLVDDQLITALHKLRSTVGSNRELAKKLKFTPAHIGRLLNGEINYLEDKNWERIEVFLKPFIKEKPKQKNNLTKPEKVLLEKFRKLSPEFQQKALLDLEQLYLTSIFKK